MRRTASPPTEPRWASLEEASVYTSSPEDGTAGIPVRTFRDWIARGLLPAYRFGPRQLRVDLNDIDRMIRPVPTVGLVEARGRGSAG